MTNKVFLIITVLFCSNAVNAQADSSRVEQYCQLIVEQRMLSNKVTIDIDFGDGKNFGSDNRLTAADGKIRKFNTIIGAMNYMGQAGWIFINAWPVHTGVTEVYHFGFRKQFTKAEVQP